MNVRDSKHEAEKTELQQKLTQLKQIKDEKKKTARSKIRKHRNRAHIQLNKLFRIHNAQTNGYREKERDYSEEIELLRRNPWNESEVAERMGKV
jgi:ElaB/YqjD/DUF883 family membrane-anchored ribosome-binding protein